VCAGTSEVHVDMPEMAGVYLVSIIRSGTYIAVRRIIRIQ
jgi:hypothetical protein